MSDLDNDIARGCLKNGEPIEAKWGSGWWSGSPFPEPEQEIEICQCPKCGGNAYFLGISGIDCENCGNITQEEYHKLTKEKEIF